jgi:hypothetical protein
LLRRQAARKFAYDRKTGIDWGLGNTLIALKEAMLPACVPYLVDDLRDSYASAEGEEKATIKRMLDDFSYGHEEVDRYWQLRNRMEELGLRMSDKTHAVGAKEHERLWNEFLSCDDRVQNILTVAGAIYDVFHRRASDELAREYFADKRFHDKMGRDITEKIAPYHAHERLLQRYISRLEMHPEIK